MSRARDLADGTFTGEVTVNDTVRLDTGDTTVSTDDIFGDIEFYDNDGGSTGAGVTAKIQATAASTYGASQLIFSTSSSSGGARTTLTERVRIQSGGGISFNGDTAAANALDDYEEGTWTPVAFGTSSSGTASYSIQKGFYVKIGRSVHYQMYIGWTGHTGTGTLRFSGLPYNADISGNVAYSAPTVSYVSGLTFGSGQLGGYITSGGNAISILMNNSNTNPTAINVDANVTEIIISGVYATT